MSLQQKSRGDTNHVKRNMESLEYEPNPDVAPYQSSNFMSSTILKKVPISKRHLDTFGSYECSYMGNRGVMLHTDRYQVDFIKSFDGLTQRERLQAGLNYVEAMRGTRRRRELMLHRAQLDLILGGKQIEFEERFYIARELQKLKALAMPGVAKDLYHGRGIQLPTNHNSLKPRYPMPDDGAEEAMVSAPSSLQTVLRKNDTQHEFPRIERDPTFLGKGNQLRTRSTLNRHPQLPSIRGRVENDQNLFLAVSKSGEKRTVTNLSARLGLTHRINRDVTSLSRSHTQAPPPSRDSGQDQSQRFLTKGKAGPTTRRKVALPIDMTAQNNQRLPESHTEIVDAKQLPAPTDAPTAEQGIEGTQKTQSLSGARASKDFRERPNTEERLNNPLRGTDLTETVSEDEREELRQTFQKLDTDRDGHLQYNQLKTQLPKALSAEQERFIEEVYKLTNSMTVFGVDEFMAMNRLSKTVEALSGRSKEAFSSVDFSSIADQLLRYVDKFGTADTGNHGNVTIESLQQILSEMLSPSLVTDPAQWSQVLDMISVDYGAKITKISFIAHIPLFLDLEKDYK